MMKDNGAERSRAKQSRRVLSHTFHNNPLKKSDKRRDGE